ncbi:MAG: hypothetical protein WB767_08210, partial [Nocardioides sp.]
LSGDRLDEPGLDGAEASAGAAEPTAVRATELLDAADPGERGPYDVLTSDYELKPVKLPGMRQPIEMVGHVVEPGNNIQTFAPVPPRPLVLFLHGRHGVCYDPTAPEGEPGADDGTWPCKAPAREIPSHLGYVYAQELLASQGFTTVSIRVNGINAQDYRLPDGGAGARARIVQEHLEHWVDLAAEHRVDLNQVVLVGHSRGGEGVDRAAIDIPLTAPYRIAGQVLLAPTDFASHSAPYVPTVTVLPYCDGDVSDLQGQRFTDTGRDVAADDTSLKSSVLVMGANHNFFNTEWTPRIAAAPSFDDWFGEASAPCGRKHPERLKAGGQRAVGQAYIAGAVALFTGNDRYLPLFDGSAVTVASIGESNVLSHAIGGGRELRRPGIEATPTLTQGAAATRLCSGVATFESTSFAVCGRALSSVVTPHWTSPGEGAPTRQFFEMAWNRVGATGGLRFDEALDLSARRLELRTIIDPRRGAVDLAVRLGDSTGASAVLALAGGEPVEPLPDVPGLTKLWAQALIADPMPAAGVDLTDITSVELVSKSARGRVWVADVATAPATLAPVPAVRLPQLNLGQLKLDEGDENGRHTARVPFTITSPVLRPSRFVAQIVGQARGSVHRLTVDVAPGQTGGSIPIVYTADLLDDYDSQTQVSVWPIRGLATGDYLGRLDVVDDDATPEITVVPTQAVVHEGESIEWTVSLAGRVDYDLYVGSQAIKGPGEDLRGNDVPLSWLEKRADVSRLRQPLWRLYVGLYDQIRVGETETTLTIPIARDARREGPEKLTVRFFVGEERVTQTITVLDESPPGQPVG